MPIALLATLLVGCWGPERLSGPSITVQNDTTRDLVLRQASSAWTVPGGSTEFLGLLDRGALDSGATFTIHDVATCAKLDTLQLTFRAVPDPMIVISDTAPPTARAMSTEERQSLGAPASASPFKCGGADAWQMLVVNKADIPYKLSMLPPDLGTGNAAHIKFLFDVPAATTGSITWPPSSVGAAGQIDLLDPLDCSIKSNVNHPATGSQVLTIGADGTLTLTNGEIPDGTTPLQFLNASTGGTGCVPIASPTG